MKQKKYLVTGGAGFIGSNLVDALLERGNRVVVVDNFSTGKIKNLAEHRGNKNLKIYKKDINDNLSAIFKKNKFDAVFHVAALPRVQFSIAQPLKTNRANLDGTLNLLETCRRFRVKRFIFSSSSSIYGGQKTLPLIETMKPNPLSPYALHKLASEHYCRLYNLIHGMETISLRYFNVYGPKQDPRGQYAILIPKFTYLIKHNKRPKINGDGEQTRDFTHVSDVVRANLLAAKTRNKKCFGEMFNIGAGDNQSVNKVTNLILKNLKKNLKPVHGPAVIEPHDTLADVRKAKKLLGWSPKVKFEKGIKLTIKSFL